MRIVIIHAEPRPDDDVLDEVLRDEGHEVERLEGLTPTASGPPARDPAADAVIVVGGVDLQASLVLVAAARARWPGAGCLLLASRRPLPAGVDRSSLPEILLMPFGLEALLGALRRACGGAAA